MFELSEAVLQRLYPQVRLYPLTNNLGKHCAKLKFIIENGRTTFYYGKYGRLANLPVVNMQENQSIYQWSLLYKTIKNVVRDKKLQAFANKVGRNPETIVSHWNPAYLHWTGVSGYFLSYEFAIQQFMADNNIFGDIERARVIYEGL